MSNETYCCRCGKNLIMEQVIGGKVCQRLTVDYDELKEVLADGSQTRIPICKDCKAKES